MQPLSKQVSPRKTPQSEPIIGRETDMEENSAGGFVFAVDDWVRLDRFLVLGTEGGTYYINEQQLTVENSQAVIRCLKADGKRVVDRVVEISMAGRAPKNDPALFVLALACTPQFADDATRAYALDHLPAVARIGTHLFHFAAYANDLRGWGRGLRRAVGDWYLGKEIDKLGYQMVKYQQRDGWSHRDLLRLSHPKPPPVSFGMEQTRELLKWGVGGDADIEKLPSIVQAFEGAKIAADEKAVIKLIQEAGLTWEMVPTEHLKSKAVWKALLPKMPMTATLRNLARLTALGVLKPMSPSANMVIERITNAENLKRARIHPIGVLAALLTYKSGTGVRGKLTWDPVASIVDALDTAFYASFGNVVPTGKRLMLALDVSGSMGGGSIANVPGLTPCIGAATMALVTAAVEPQYMIFGFADEFRPLTITPRMRLDAATQEARDRNFGNTDCALPMQYALKHELEIDGFCVYTDSETWYGDTHPVQALAEYRRKSRIDAKLIVVGMVANNFTIADPDDAGMLDVVGFDTATPNLISDFIRGD